MATVISNKKSTYGSPYAFYTLDLSYSNRTTTSVVVSYTLKVNLQYSASNLGTGYALTAIIYAGGSNSGEITLKPSNTSWSGTSVKTFTGSFTVTGLSPSTTSISTALYSSAYYGGAYRACIRPAVSGSDLSIPEQTKYTITYNANGGSGAPSSQSYYYGGSNIYLSSTIPTKSGYNFLGWSLSSTATSPSYYAGQAWSSSNASNYTLYAVWEVANNKSTFILSKNVVDLDSSFSIYITRIVSSNTHTAVLTLNGTNYTLSTGLTTSGTWTLPASTYASLFTTSKSISGTITLTTYSGSTSLGSVSQGITLVLPELLGKPSTPTATLTSETSTGASISLTRPIFKYNATFKEWQVSSNVGEVSVSGDVITCTIDLNLNKIATARIQAVDSRGFASDPVFVVWHKSISGGCVYDSGLWKNATKYIYYNGAWVKVEDAIYNNYNWYYSDGCTVKLVDRMLISSGNYILNSSDGYTLKGKRG